MFDNNNTSNNITSQKPKSMGENLGIPVCCRIL